MYYLHIEHLAVTTQHKALKLMIAYGSVIETFFKNEICSDFSAARLLCGLDLSGLELRNLPEYLLPHKCCNLFLILYKRLV